MDFFNSLLGYSDYGVALLRIALGIVFLKHGMMKFGLWNMRPSDQMPAQMLNIMRILSIVEPIAGFAIVFGVFTQFAAIALAVVMIGAMYFKIFKWKKPFAGDGGWEFDFILLAVTLALIFSGGGAWSVDALLK